MNGPSRDSTTTDLAVAVATDQIVEAIRTAVETVRDVQVDGAQCDPNPDYRRGWIAACERLLDGLDAEEEDADAAP